MYQQQNGHVDWQVLQISPRKWRQMETLADHQWSTALWWIAYKVVLLFTIAKLLQSALAR
jgi:hypothetical protein